MTSLKLELKINKNKIIANKNIDHDWPSDP